MSLKDDLRDYLTSIIALAELQASLEKEGVAADVNWKKLAARTARVRERLDRSKKSS